MNKQDLTEAAATAASAASAGWSKASVATYTGSLSLIGGWLLSSQAAVLVGMVVGVVGLYFRWKEHQMRKLEHAAKMAQAGFYE